MSIQFVFGDIFTTNACAILHQTNCRGVMGGGIAFQVRKRYPEVYEKYRALCQKEGSRLLGSVEIESTKYGPQIVNVFGQDVFDANCRCTSYDALENALSQVAKQFAGRTVALPYKMSCGLAGGNWVIVKAIIQETIGKFCNVLIYRLPNVPLDSRDIPGKLHYFKVRLQADPDFPSPHCDCDVFIRGVRTPSTTEAEIFLLRLRKLNGLRIGDIKEISWEEARATSTLDDEREPVFGLEELQP